MPERLSESPFRDVSDGRPWHYTTDTRPAAPEMPERSLRLTLLGLGLLGYAGLIAPAFLPMSLRVLVFVLVGFMAPERRPDLPLALLFFAGVYLPIILTLVGALAFFRQTRWAPRWTVSTLPIALLSGAFTWGLYFWFQLSQNARVDVPPFAPEVIGPLGWYAIAMVPFTGLLLYLVTRPQVAEELAEAQAQAETPAE